MQNHRTLNLEKSTHKAIHFQQAAIDSGTVSTDRRIQPTWIRGITAKKNRYGRIQGTIHRRTRLGFPYQGEGDEIRWSPGGSPTRGSPGVDEEGERDHGGSSRGGGWVDLKIWGLAVRRGGHQVCWGMEWC
jgi:hypothetical protein